MTGATARGAAPHAGKLPAAVLSHPEVVAALVPGQAVWINDGKLRAEAMGETLGAISEVRYYAGLARNVRGTMQETLPGQMSLFHREAAGVAGIIVLMWFMA